ncbi:hypothetical protein LP43_0764 [Methylophaga thiooxydans]|uniref:Sensory/regulatory protein RpfC n=1 Tax=Methylophaga thiooxydans TaxID=392484 RepID=A0A0A0BGS9_9GAMM|nr:ATP-binding protein [Methylophaga thiooxydans]KGM07156.1 hypothetical protein LP43_0764 [Methylophaga thiooxydans]
MDEAHETAPVDKKTSRFWPQTGDTEPEQAIKVRLTIGLFVLLYFALPWGAEDSFITTLFSTPSLITMGYYSGALMIAGAIFLNPRPSPIRRIAGSVLDLTSLSILMFYSGDESVFLFVLYLWVILGNGFRYGTRYLYISLAIGLIGFSTAVSTGAYWQDLQHKPIGFSLILLLVLIPLYSAFLINKLHAAIRTAKLANEAKSRFLANMSHELRTPLNGVIGIADLLGETSLSHQQLDFVNIMRNSANTLLGLIENVLDISKIEAGKITISQQNFDLHALINNTVQLQTAMGEAKGLQVSHCIDSDIDSNLVGDPQHLRQVLINLMGNAIKFTDSGTVKLLIKQSDTATIPNKMKVRFEVKDSGIGISDEHIGKIFENFTQVDTGNSVKYQGTGLGTTISKQLVELMGGEIGVESELGVGTCFWFELPFETNSDYRLELTDQKVLIFTSNRVAETLQDSLDSWDLKYDSVLSSAQAMTALMNAEREQSPFTTLIIEDSAMAGISPVQYAQMLSQEEKLEQLSLILVNPDHSILDDAELNQYYTSSIKDVSNKRTIFNALHAVEASHNTNNNVVGLHDYYRAQANNDLKLRILVAEDNLVNQKVLEGMLSKLGHELLLARTGEQAMDLIMQNHDSIDLMILDMNMPEYSGVEILQASSFLETSRKIPSIILTADATPEARQRSEEAGVDVFLTKPVNSKALLTEIAKISRQSLKQGTPAQQVQQHSTTGLLNYQLLEELETLGGSKDFMASLIESFVEDGRKHLQIINTAVTDDYYQYRESLHALKGSSTEIGALELSVLCRQAENLKPEQINSSEMFTLVEKINHIFEETLSALEGALRSSPYQTNH